jgi:hypothetical protein
MDKIYSAVHQADLHYDDAREAHRALRNYFDVDQGERFIMSRLKRVAAWADRHRLPRDRIMLGEFGCMRNVYNNQGATPADRARWIGTTRQIAESYGFRWSVWSLTNTMGIVTGDEDGELDTSVLKALGLTHF